MNISDRYFKGSHARVLLVSFLIGIGVSLCLGMNRSLVKAINALRPNMVVAVLYPSKLPDVDARRATDSLKSLDPLILSVAFISKEDAIKSAQSDPVLAKSLMVLKDNPLPASALLRFDDRAWLDRSEPAEKLRAIPEMSEIRWDAQLGNTFRVLFGWRQWAHRFQNALGAVLALLFVISLSRVLMVRPSGRFMFERSLIGLLGGALSMLFWLGSFRSLSPEAAQFMPVVAYWPVLTGILTGLASTAAGETPRE